MPRPREDDDVPSVMVVVPEVWVLLEARVLNGSACEEVELRVLLLWKTFLRIVSTCFTSAFSIVYTKTFWRRAESASSCAMISAICGIASFEAVTTTE